MGFWTSPQAREVLRGGPVGASSSVALSKLAAGFVLAAVAVDLNFGDTGLNLGNLVLIGIAAVLVIHSFGDSAGRGQEEQLLSHDWVYLLSMGIMLASISWSVSAIESFVTVVPLIALWVATLFLCRLPLNVAVRLVVRIALIAAVLSLLVIPLSASYAYQPFSSTGSPELRGIFKHQLRLGSFMALAIGLLVIARMNGQLTRVASKSRLANLFCLSLLVMALWLSHTRLYVGAAALAVLLTWILSRRDSRRWIALCVGAISAVPLVGGFGIFLSRLEASGFDTSLTGRTQTWTRTLSAIAEDNRLLGYGFGTFKLPEFDSLFLGDYRPSHAHSSFVQSYFETGLVGLAVLIVLILVQGVATWRYSVRCNCYSYGLFLVLYNAIGSATGLNYAGSASAMFCVMMLFIAIESRVTVNPPDVVSGSKQMNAGAMDDDVA